MIRAAGSAPRSPATGAPCGCRWKTAALSWTPGSVTTLTQPFRRLGADRTGSATGTGLGLSIAEAIATAHGGTLRLYARPEGGLRAVVSLPATDRTGPPAQLAATGGTQ